jgi:hypothetical protein
MKDMLQDSPGCSVRNVAGQSRLYVRNIAVQGRFYGKACLGTRQDVRWACCRTRHAECCHAAGRARLGGDEEADVQETLNTRKAGHCLVGARGSKSRMGLETIRNISSLIHMRKH